MFWRCFSAQGVGPLIECQGHVDAQQYVNILMEAITQENIGNLFPPDGKFIVADDNAPVHTAKKVSQWFNVQEFVHLLWPLQSPDLNPIKNLWLLIKRRLSCSKPTSKKDLITKVCAVGM